MAGARSIEPTKPTRGLGIGSAAQGLPPGPPRETPHPGCGKLMQDWSPEQISGWLKQSYPDDENLRVSHETINRSLFIQARGALKQELIQHLRSQRRIRRSRHSSVHGHSQGKIVDAISIRERPAEMEDRAIPGHWEETYRWAGNTHVVTLVERKSRFCVLVKVPGKDTATVVAALIQYVGQLPAELRRSLTWDRGWRWPNTKPSRWRRICRFTSAIRRVPGAWLKRKHKRPAAAIPAKERRPVQVFAIGAERDRSAPQYPATTNLGIRLRRINCRPVLRRSLETTPFLGTYLVRLPTSGLPDRRPNCGRVPSARPMAEELLNTPVTQGICHTSHSSLGGCSETYDAQTEIAADDCDAFTVLGL